MTEKTEAALRTRIEELMHAGVRADREKLDALYHDDLQILFLGADGELMTVDKQGCLAMLEQTFKDKNPDDHMWAKFHAATVSGDRGHVLISRKIPIGGPETLIDLSIDLVFEDGRWQVVREVNFVRPDAKAA
ncbi:nuclear transport factor 2 family protein [Novosphingobium beihaiensis]|uniref:Nuclear transport factor 2 family protein n=1 Tax=Novosphingobium beihaiensis TaxID=2930389 RepID=A0ABT0BKJ0_9SPHN|nr:nuclear transport factor 2 family protein [Novosphingobium beihaiensis]MCJ2185498.1 nuclear transport factor 2 family protein [Novosphingobium beihaiensis]